jgi:hypothetical protein
VTDDTDATPANVSVAVACSAAAGMTVLGAIGIGRSFGYDEGYTYFYFINGGSVRTALTTQVVFNNHPTFSATQAIAWRLGLVGESAQRLGPVLCAAATVGLIVWYTARRCGVVGGLGAGVVLALNPIYLDQVRQLRGYSLATLGVVVAGLALQRSWFDHRHRWLVIQAAAMVVAVTTHAYSALALLMFAAATLGLGRLRIAHLFTWFGAAVVAFTMQIPLLDETSSNLKGRGHVFRDRFPIDLVRALLGFDWPAVIVIGALTAAGITAVVRRSSRHATAIAAGGAVLVTVVVLLWAVVQPRDLYFRFFITVIPLLAHLAGRGIALLPGLIGPIAVVAVAVVLAGGTADIVGQRPTIRDGAAVAERARAGDHELCGRHVEPLFVYTAPFRPINGIDDFDGCEVFISVLSVSREQRLAADERFDARRDLGGSVRVWADADIIDDVVLGLP